MNTISLLLSSCTVDYIIGLDCSYKRTPSLFQLGRKISINLTFNVIEPITFLPQDFQHCPHLILAFSYLTVER